MGSNGSDDLQDQNTQEKETTAYIMDAACIQEHYKIIQQAVNSHLESASLCIENQDKYFEQLLDYLIKCSSKFI
jgi:hypothetical protein